MSKNEFVCDCNIIHEELVNSTISKMKDDDTINRVAEFFKILGDNTRVKILFALDQNELCVCDIAAITNSTVSAISHQLRILKNAKLVKFRKVGKVVYYEIADSHVSEIFKKGLEHIEEI